MSQLDRHDKGPLLPSLAHPVRSTILALTAMLPALTTAAGANAQSLKDKVLEACDTFAPYTWDKCIRQTEEANSKAKDNVVNTTNDHYRAEAMVDAAARDYNAAKKAAGKTREDIERLQDKESDLKRRIAAMRAAMGK